MEKGSSALLVLVAIGGELVEDNSLYSSGKKRQKRDTLRVTVEVGFYTWQ